MNFCFLLKKKGTSLSNKYSQQLSDSAKKSTTDAIKTASKRTIQKTTEAPGDLVGNKIADKMTNISKELSKLRLTELHSKKLQTNEANNESEIPKERYISPEKQQQIIDELRLV